MASAGKRLGELLVDEGLLRPWQVELALQEQRLTGEFLGAVLVRKGWITQGILLRVLAEQAGVPYVHLDHEEVDWSLARRIPHALLEGHHCFPLRMDKWVVTVAIADPLDVWTISQLEHEFPSRKVQFVLASEQEIRSALQRSSYQARQARDVSHKGSPHDTDEEAGPTIS